MPPTVDPASLKFPSTKRCSKCSAVKNVADFYPRQHGRHGVEAVCKACRRAYFASPVGLERNLRASSAYRARNRHKGRASDAVLRAVRRGHLVRPDACEDCGTTDARLHGHHEDYERQLDVVWVCPACHGLRHRIMRRNAG